jgi:hypothetical protein
MKARAGDRLLIRGHSFGEEPRDGEILEVRGPSGAPPYVVRWENGHIGFVFPGPDAVISRAHGVGIADGAPSATLEARS